MLLVVIFNQPDSLPVDYKYMLDPPIVLKTCILSIIGYLTLPLIQ